MQTLTANSIKFNTMMTGWNRTVIVTGQGRERVWHEFDVLRTEGGKGWTIKRQGKDIGSAKTLKSAKFLIAEAMSA